jgi:hypothetical protein
MVGLELCMSCTLSQIQTFQATWLRPHTRSIRSIDHSCYGICGRQARAQGICAPITFQESELSSVRYRGSITFALWYQ